MKARDRLVVAVIAAVLVIGAVWLVLVAPERSKVNSLSQQISTERAALTTAQTTLDSARRAVSAYVANVHQLSFATRAVPASPGEDQLIKTIDRLAGTNNVDFHELDINGDNASATGGPLALGLTFSFNSNYGNLQSFLKGVDALTMTSGNTVNASGRLFTIESVSLQPNPPSSTRAAIIAEVYQQAPAGATGATGATGASQ
jgi:Tfp pilus assembly protein PilO